MLQFWPPPRALVASLLETVDFPAVLVEAAAAPPASIGSDADAPPSDVVDAPPPFASYGHRLWRYWEEHLDPRRHRPGLDEVVGGKVVLVTGASTGIGRQANRLRTISRASKGSRPGDSLLVTVT